MEQTVAADRQEGILGSQRDTRVDKPMVIFML